MLSCNAADFFHSFRWHLLVVAWNSLTIARVVARLRDQVRSIRFVKSQVDTLIRHSPNDLAPKLNQY